MTVELFKFRKTAQWLRVAAAHHFDDAVRGVLECWREFQHVTTSDTHLLVSLKALNANTTRARTQVPRKRKEPDLASLRGEFSFRSNGRCFGNI